MSIPASTLLANDTDPNGLTLSISGVSNASNGTVSYNASTQTISFVPASNYTGPASFTYTITDGQASASGNVSLSVTPPVTAQSLFNPSDTPAMVTVNDPNAVTRRQVPGLYQRHNHGHQLLQGPAEHGHACGRPVELHGNVAGERHIHQRDRERLAAGQLLDSSVHHRGDDVCRFLPHEQRGLLGRRQLFRQRGHQRSADSAAQRTSGGDGVYAYGSGSIFPTNSFNASNYWVDVVFNGSANQPPVANPVSGLVDITNTTLSIPASTLLANDSDPGGLPLSISGVSNPSNGTVTYNASTQTVSFVPNANYTGPASFTYTITDGQDSASANVALTVNDASLFGQATTPSVLTVNDPNSVELGVNFQASENGTITGIEFYKGPQNTGTHVADLWSATGTLLATATFTNETASGWQEVNFSNPVPITAGTTYIASYHTNGDYSATPNLFATALTNGPLTAPASSTSGGNGVYAYGSGSIFPTNSFNATSYGVDVLFRPQLVA